MLELEETENPFFYSFLPSVFWTRSLKQIWFDPPCDHRSFLHNLVIFELVTAATPRGLAALNLCWLSSWPLQSSLIIAVNCRMPHFIDFVSFQPSRNSNCNDFSVYLWAYLIVQIVCVYFKATDVQNKRRINDMYLQDVTYCTWQIHTAY